MNKPAEVTKTTAREDELAMKRCLMTPHPFAADQPAAGTCPRPADGSPSEAEIAAFYSEPPREEGKHRFMAGTCVDCGRPLDKVCAANLGLKPAEVTEKAAEPTWVPVYVERAICDLIPNEGHAREIARVAWAWDDAHVGYENALYRWQNEAIRQRRDLIALQEQINYEPYPEPAAPPVADEGATMKIKHEGFSPHRRRQNPLEDAYAKAWEEQAPGTLKWLLKDSSDQSQYSADYSPRDAKVAATIIQWLGSPVGSDFVREVLRSAEAK